MSVKVRDLIPEEIVREKLVLPVESDGRTLRVQTTSPVDIPLMNRLERHIRMKIVAEPVPETELKAAIETFFQGDREIVDPSTDTSERKIHDMLQDDTFMSRQGTRIGQDTGHAEEKSFAIRILDGLLEDAVRNRASDIHIEPDESTSRVRFRIDGVLIENSILLQEFHSAIVSRLKIMAKLDIAKKMIPQDGSLTIEIDNTRYDMRLSTLPTIYGEKVVLRVVGSNQGVPSLEELGFEEDDMKVINRAITSPHGIILATGPTGSGKTTTLYSLLSVLNTVDVNIITVEDPVENRIRFVNQVQVNPKGGLTFATGLRSILRQDPNVVMVGEIRDFETAKIAVETALTGHLVLSTIHANSAAGVVTRLVEMGVEPYLVTSALTAVFSQRLVRNVCTACREGYEPEPDLIRELGLDEDASYTFYHHRGCPKCNNTGYKGRTGIYEMFTLNDPLRKMIIERAPTNYLEKENSDQGHRTLRDNGLRKVVAGVTTLEEVLRVTG